MVKDWLVASSDSPIGIPLSKLGECIHYLADFLGRDWVSTETESYRAWRKDCSLPILWNHRPPHTNPLIPMFSVFEDWHGNTKKSKPPTAVIDLATIAGAIWYFEPYWSSLGADTGRKHIRTYLRNADKCRGMIYELISAFHYVRAGATPVTPRFMNPSQTDKADMIITWQKVEIEVHCKSKIPGAGQKIHADFFDYLAGCTLVYFSKLTSRSLWVRLICTDELRREDVEHLLERINSLIQTGLVGDYPLCENRYILRIREIQIPPGGITVGEIDKLHKPMYRAILADNTLSVLAGRGYYRVSVFDAVSRKRPRVAASLKNSFKQAIKQVTGKRPSIVTIHFHDPMDWEVASKLEVFYIFLEQQLKAGRGKNVGALVLTGEPLTNERWTGHVYERSLPAIWLLNPYANPQVQLPASFQLLINQTK